MDKIRELANYLEIKPEEIELSDERINPRTEFRTPKGTFLVMDKDEAFEAVKEEQEWFIDDLGIEGYTKEFQDWIYENALDQEQFEEYCLEDYQAYAEDIKSESDSEYGNRLNQECVEAKIIEPYEIVNGEYVGDKDLEEELANYLVERIRKEEDGNYAAWFIWNFGNEFFTNFVKHNNIDLDYDAIAKEIIEWDGYGHVLSRWDGETIELDDDNLMAFMQDERDEREKR